MEVWKFGADIKTTAPLATRRLDLGVETSFALTALLNGLDQGEYTVQMHGYCALGAPYIAVQHTMGEVVVHIAHTRVLVSDSDSNGENGKSLVTALPFVASGGVLYHLHAVFTCDPVLPFSELNKAFFGYFHSDFF